MSSPSSQNTVPIRPPNLDIIADQQNASHSDTLFENISSEEEEVDIKTTTKPPERDRRYNRRTAGVLSEEQQSKAYNAWIASHKSRLQALTVDNLRQVHSDLIPIQEIAMYRYVKNVVNAIFSEDMKIMFSTAIEQLP